MNFAKVLCVFGIHKWTYIGSLKRTRVCSRCDISQMETYDISYGDLLWKTIKL